MGNVLHNKHMAVIKDGDLSDLWAPVATLTGVRVVVARAAAHNRRTTGIDLVAAYTQIPMGGDRPYYIIVPQLVYQIMSTNDNVKYAGFKEPLRGALRACGTASRGLVQTSSPPLELGFNCCGGCVYRRSPHCLRTGRSKTKEPL